MKKVEIFCDGSSLGNPGYGGYCAILRCKGSFGVREKIVSGACKQATNNQMELLAVIEGLRALREPCEVLVVSDSRYVCDGIEKWIYGWIQKEFKNVKNPNLWRTYLEISRIHRVKTLWVKGHANHPENQKCDTIAREQAFKLKEEYARR